MCDLGLKQVFHFIFVESLFLIFQKVYLQIYNPATAGEQNIMNEMSRKWKYMICDLQWECTECSTQTLWYNTNETKGTMQFIIPYYSILPTSICLPSLHSNSWSLGREINLLFWSHRSFFITIVNNRQNSTFHYS